MLHRRLRQLGLVVLTAVAACGEEPLVGEATGTCLGTSWSTQVPLDPGWWMVWETAVADNGEVTLLAWNQHELVNGATDNPTIAGVFVDSGTGEQRSGIFTLGAASSLFDTVRVVVAGDGGFLVVVSETETGDTQTMRIDDDDDDDDGRPVIGARRRLRDDSGLGWYDPVVATDDGMAIVLGNFAVHRSDIDNAPLPTLPGFDDLTGYCLSAVQLPTGSLLAWCVEWGTTSTADIPFLFSTRDGGAPQRTEFSSAPLERAPKMVVIDDQVLLLTTNGQRLRARTFDFDGTVRNVVDIADHPDSDVLSWDRAGANLTLTGDGRALLSYQHHRDDDISADTLTTGTLELDDDGVPLYVEGASYDSEHHGAGSAAGGGAVLAWVHEGFHLFPWETGPQTLHIQRQCGVGD